MSNIKGKKYKILLYFLTRMPLPLLEDYSAIQ